MLNAFRLWSLAFLLVAGAATSLAAPTNPYDGSLVTPVPQAGDQAYSKGLERLVAGDLEGAETAFNAALSERRGHANAMLGLAEIAFRRGNLEAAGERIRAAATLEAGSSHVHASLARYLMLQKQYAEAERELLNAIAADPRLFRARIDLADLYATALDRPEDAITAYEAAIGIDPEHAGAHYGLGMLFARQGRNERATSALAKAMQLDPDNPLPMMALARVHAGGGDLDTALEMSDRALAKQPGLVEAGLLRADILQIRGDNKAALDQLVKLARANPMHAAAQLKLGMLHQTEGRFKDAQRVYLRVVEIDPNLALAYNNLAWMAAENKTDLVRAEKWAKKAVELAPQVAAFHDTVGWVYRAMGKLDAAEQVLAEAAKMDPESAEIHAHLGQVYLEQNKIDDAESAFRSALALDQDYSPARLGLQRLRRE